MNTHERITRQVRRLVLTHPFIAHLALGLEVIVSDEPNLSAKVGNGKMIFGRAFVATLNDKQLRTLICHEVFHVANLHDLRTPIEVKQNNQLFDLWNKACDLAINHHLIGQDFEFPPNGQTDPTELKEFANMSAEKIFSDLLNDQKPDEDEPEPEGDEGEPEGDEGEENGGGGESGEGEETGGGGDEKTDDQNFDDWGTVEHTETTTEEKAKRMNDIQQAINSTKAGDGETYGVEESLKTFQQPTVDWRELLSLAVEGVANNDYSFRRPRHLGSVILPTLHDEAFGNIAFGVDTSGSMNAEAVKQAFGEVRQAHNLHFDASDECFTVMLHDRRVHSIQQIETTDDIELPSRGSGGTCFSEALMTPSTFDEAPLVLFMITDGFCAVNARDQPDFPVVWVITPNGNTQFEPTFGDVVMM